ncbi:MAG: hypothetical protein JRJ37_03630 [Deltaproteobacteria bacterium]|nr:hypothetical protein [Deltaproteobacteria bacterium]
MAAPPIIAANWTAEYFCILLSIHPVQILLVVLISFVVPTVAAGSPVTQPVDQVESSDSIGWSLHPRDILDYDPIKKSICPGFFGWEEYWNVRRPGRFLLHRLTLEHPPFSKKII